jgi:hypothetical protein
MEEKILRGIIINRENDYYDYYNVPNILQK